MQRVLSSTEAAKASRSDGSTNRASMPICRGMFGDGTGTHMRHIYAHANTHVDTRVYTDVYTHMSMHTSIFMPINMSAYMRRHMSIHVCLHTWIYIHTHVHTPVGKHVYVSFHMPITVSIQMPIRMSVHMSMHMPVMHAYRVCPYNNARARARVFAQGSAPGDVGNSNAKARGGGQRAACGRISLNIVNVPP